MKCSYCAESIKKNAIKCKHCNAWLPSLYLGATKGRILFILVGLTIGCLIGNWIYQSWVSAKLEGERLSKEQIEKFVDNLIAPNSGTPSNTPSNEIPFSVNIEITNNVELDAEVLIDKELLFTIHSYTEKDNEYAFNISVTNLGLRPNYVVPGAAIAFELVDSRNRHFSEPYQTPFDILQPDETQQGVLKIQAPADAEIKWLNVYHNIIRTGSIYDEYSLIKL